MFALACSNDDTVTTSPVEENPIPENPNPENPENPQNPNPEEGCYYDALVTLTTQAEVDAFAMYNYCKVRGIYIGNNGPAGSDITSLVGLESLKIINGTIKIFNNPHLINLQGLNNLEVAPALEILNNNALVSLEGLDSLKAVGGLYIKNNASLTTLQGIGPVKEVDIFHIAYNASLQNLNGLESIETLTTGLGIRECWALSSISGLSGLKTVSGLSISYSPLLTSIEPLENMINVNTVTIEYTGIISLKGLQNITEPHILAFYHNAALHDFCDIENVLHPNLDLWISYNMYNPTVTDIEEGNCSN